MSFYEDTKDSINKGNGIEYWLKVNLEIWKSRNTYYNELISSSDTHDDILTTAMIFLYYASENLREDVEINNKTEYKDNLKDLQDIIMRISDNMLMHDLVPTNLSDKVYSYKDYKKDLEKEIGK